MKLTQSNVGFILNPIMAIFNPFNQPTNSFVGKHFSKNLIVVLTTYSIVNIFLYKQFYVFGLIYFRTLSSYNLLKRPKIFSIRTLNRE